MEKAIPFTGILSNNAQENPGFHSTETILRFWATQIMLKKDLLNCLAHIVPYDCRFF